MTKPRVSFYIGAHQDDWQIFHGAQAQRDAREVGVVVAFIYITAGDGGRTDGWWEAREVAALATCTEITGLQPKTERPLLFNGRQVARRDVGSTHHYFLRLPDGGYPGWGDGYASQHHQSLWKLLKGEAPITAIEGSASYENWQQLVDTVESIVRLEQSESSSDHPWINTSDYLIGGVTPCQFDHCDHYATGEIVRNFALGRYNTLYWGGYNDPKRNIAVSDEDLRTKQALLNRYDTVIREAFGTGIYENEDDKKFYDGLMRLAFYRAEHC